LGVRSRLGLQLQSWVVQPAGQPPAGCLKVGTITGQRRLTTRAHHQQGSDKVTKGFALMAVCLRQLGVDK